MRVAVVSYQMDRVVPSLKKLGHTIVTRRPEIVIALGGDGTFLYAEEKFPNVPKVFIYHSRSCKKCCIHNFEPILSKLGKLKLEPFVKLHAKINGKTISAINDINIHYCPPRALRFRLRVNGKIIADDVIGDGVVIATPLGSKAYYHSITGQTFRRGIGIAFNHPTRRIRARVVPENSRIEIDILRENGVVAHDTNNKVIKIKRGDKIIVKRESRTTRAIIFKR